MGVVDWSELHPDMLTLVGEYLTHVNDHLTFSMVCSSWRSVAIDLRPSLPFGVPLLMLPGDDNPNLQTRNYFSLSEQKSTERKTSFPHSDICVGSQGGWLVTQHKNLEMSLFNPFSLERLPLPSLTTIPGIEDTVMDSDVFLETASLSSNDMRVSPKDLTVMIAHFGGKELAFAKSGDKVWHIIDNKENIWFSSIVFYKDNFYATGDRETVLCEIGSNPQLTSVAPTLPSYKYSAGFTCYKWYLVESLGELILVERWIHMYDDNINPNIDNYVTADFDLPGEVTLPREKLADSFKTYKTVYFTVYKFDFVRREWIQMKNLNDQIIFVGRNTSFSLNSFGMEDCKSNSIYFTEDYIEGEWCARTDKYRCYGYDMGVFDMIDGSIKPLFDYGTNSFFPAPMWVIYRPW